MAVSYKQTQDYKIVVPSRHRAHNMPTIRRLLPTAYVFIDERELDDYAGLVPKKQLITHAPTKNLVQVRNLIPKAFPAAAVVEIDDDLQFVRMPRILASNRTDDPNEILQIIENGVAIAMDLDVTVFCWPRTTNNAVLDPNYRTFCLNQQMSCSFILRGAALTRRWDERMLGKGDFDFTLQTLAEDRVVMSDTRFYFEHGRIFSGLGGNVTLVTPDDITAADRRLKEKWGDAIAIGGRAGRGRGRGRSTPRMALKVTRKNPIAVR